MSFAFHPGGRCGRSGSGHRAGASGAVDTWCGRATTHERFGDGGGRDGPAGAVFSGRGSGRASDRCAGGARARPADARRGAIGRALRAVAILGACMAMVLAPAVAAAEDYPVRPLHMIIPYGPGTGIDAIGRMFAQKLAAELGQPVVVENKAGASGIIGAEAVVKSPPDGYTLFFSAGSVYSLNASLFAKLPYDGTRSFTPVSFVYSQPFVVATSLKVPARTLPELVSLAAAKPGSLTAGTLGSFHLLALQHFSSATRTRFTNVPYKTGTMVALLSGEIDVMVDVISLVIPQSKAGKIRALAVTSEKRMPIAPDLPTMAELGYPGFEMATWTALAGPANMPRPIVDKLNAATVRILASREMTEFAGAQGVTLASSTPERMAEIIRDETVRWQKVARDAGIKPE